MRTHFRTWITCAVLSLSPSLPALAQQADKGGLDLNGPYKVVPNWFKPGVRWNQPVTGVVADKPNRIIITSSGEQITQAGSVILAPDGKLLNPTRDPDAKKPEKPTHEHMILVLNADGKVIEDWSQWNDQIVLAHNVEISPYDPERHVWVVDREGAQIFKFTNDGKKIALHLGEKGKSGDDHYHFNWPAGLTFLPDGSFFIADGYRNSRIIKYDKNGKYLMEWGTKGDGPGQFNLVHGVAVDNTGRLYVSDRGNNRIQIFDQSGKYLDEWRNARTSHLILTQDGGIWAVAGENNRLVKFDLNGHVQTAWGVYGRFPEGFDDPHTFDLDAEGNLYLADTFNNRIDKFTPRPGADKSRLIAPKLIPK